MYQVFCDNTLICDSRTEDICIINPIVKLEINTANSFKFTFPAGHPYIDFIDRMKSVIRVERDGEIIFQGFCISEITDLWGNKNIECEGELSYLNDSILRPNRYQGYTVLSLLTSYITQHNSQVEEKKRFEIGNVTVTDPNNYIYCYTNMNTTLQEIKEDLIDDYGGFIYVRYSNGHKYIDYVSESTKYSEQIIRLGVNLIDYNSNIDDNEIATRVIPLGDLLEEEVIEGLSTRLDIKTVNDGVDYLQSDDAIANFGILTKVAVFNGIHDPAILKTKGQAWLNENQFENVVIEVKAFDLGNIYTTDKFRLFDTVHVISEYHGMDRWFPLTKMELYLNNPENDVYTLGKKIQLPLSVKTNGVTSDTKSIINAFNPPAWLVQAKEEATALITGAEGGFVVFNVDQYGRPFELLVMDTDSKETATKVWRWNQNGFGYSNNGYAGPYGLAMTMDGSIVADYIKTGVLRSVKIQNGNNAEFQVDENGNMTASSATIKSTATDSSWTGVTQGEIRGGTSASLTHGRINFTFGQIFPVEGALEGVLQASPAIGLKGRIATTLEPTRPGNCPTVRNVLIDLANSLYAECDENGVGTWQSFNYMNFVNGFLVLISDSGEYYPV